MSESDSNSAFWIIVGSTDNFSRTRELGFSVQGIKSRHRKKAEKMKPGDKIVWYLTGVKAFGGVATITSRYFESHDRIWQSGDPKKETEDYPFRFQISPDVVLEKNNWVPAEPIARQMTYVSKWPANNWTLAFQGNVHVIDANDFALIAAAINERKAVDVGGVS